MPRSAPAAGLVVENLVKSFGGVVAVGGVSFTVALASSSLLGPSGYGKTTTCAASPGSNSPARDGSHQRRDDRQRGHPDVRLPNRRHFGMVFQSYAIWPHMTVFNNVAYPLKVQRKHKQDKICELVKEKLRIVGLADYDDRIRTSSPAGSSKGWRWRAPWSWSRGSCCSTSRSAISTPSSGSACASS